MAINKTKMTEGNLKYIASMLIDMGIKNLVNTLNKKLYELGLEGYSVQLGDYYSTNDYVWVRIEGGNAKYKLGYSLQSGRYKPNHGYAQVRKGADVCPPKELTFSCEESINMVLKGLLSVSIPVSSIEFKVGSLNESELVVQHSGRNEYTLNFS